ncbi:MAG TPA: sigma factor, partial [Pyrinomonadaceae bacterium]|nr:sigma factor [Pyrinomonadaceae bacterium]
MISVLNNLTEVVRFLPACEKQTIHVTAGETETPQTDYELAQKAAQGDMAAFENLYERHNRRVYSLCLRMTGSVSEAEDLAQEVFIQL